MKKEYKNYAQYLVVKCVELSDQYECDADRFPILVTSKYSVAKKKRNFPFEIYGIDNDGKVNLIKGYY